MQFIVAHSHTHTITLHQLHSEVLLFDAAFLNLFYVFLRAIRTMCVCDDAKGAAKGTRQQNTI